MWVPICLVSSVSQSFANFFDVQDPPSGRILELEGLLVLCKS